MMTGCGQTGGGQITALATLDDRPELSAGRHKNQGHVPKGLANGLRNLLPARCRLTSAWFARPLRSTSKKVQLLI